jgi:pimeloyl-ACP methyl ester carboxylesterase
VHGYGASAYHWRYNIPQLAEKYHVLAPCLLGFGYSDRAVIDYKNGDVWVQQLADFIEEVWFTTCCNL